MDKEQYTKILTQYVKLRRMLQYYPVSYASMHLYDSMCELKLWVEENYGLKLTSDEYQAIYDQTS